MQRRVEVVVRVRATPHDPDVCVELHENRRTISVFDPSLPPVVDHRRDYRGDTLVGPHVSNEEIFNTVVWPRVSAATPDTPDTLCFLAYGHTNSGKTHTVIGSDTEPGVLSLCVQELLRREGVVEVAMLEVYMDQVYDLLAHSAPRRVRRCPAPAALAVRAASPSGHLHAKEDMGALTRRCGASRGDRPSTNRSKRSSVVVVEDLTTCVLTSMEEWGTVTRYGLQSRRTAPTERNTRSSRSHAIFTVKSHGVRLCFVDLAGSERQTVYSPQLNQESIAINKSLSRLSTVLEALSSRRACEGAGESASSYVNFRDTTLTVLLQRYLSGTSRTTFLACIHPAAPFYAETLSTLRYTERLARIKTRAMTRTDTLDEEMRHVAALSSLRGGPGVWATQGGGTLCGAQTGIIGGGSSDLLQELIDMRRQVRESQKTCERREQTQQQRIAELERMLHESHRRQLHQTACAAGAASSPDQTSSDEEVAAQRRAEAEAESECEMVEKSQSDTMHENNSKNHHSSSSRSTHARPSSHNRRSRSRCSRTSTWRRVHGTTRCAGWLLRRVSGNLPLLRICFDEYFDSLFQHSGLQVLSYVTTMACLPPRGVHNNAKRNVGSGVDYSSLVFLDVGDLLMGLSMLDAGIPPSVRLHDSDCAQYHTWQGIAIAETAHDEDGAGCDGNRNDHCYCYDNMTSRLREHDMPNDLLYVLAFFEKCRDTLPDAACGEENARRARACAPMTQGSAGPLGRAARTARDDDVLLRRTCHRDCDIQGARAHTNHDNTDCNNDVGGIYRSDEDTLVECCEGYRVTEPLLPMAVVVCTPICTSPQAKETVLQRLIALHTQQQRCGSRDVCCAGGSCSESCDSPVMGSGVDESPDEEHKHIGRDRASQARVAVEEQEQDSDQEKQEWMLPGARRTAKRSGYALPHTDEEQASHVSAGNDTNDSTRVNGRANRETEKRGSNKRTTALTSIEHGTRSCVVASTDSGHSDPCADKDSCPDSILSCAERGVPAEMHTEKQESKMNVGSHEAVLTLPLRPEMTPHIHHTPSDFDAKSGRETIWTSRRNSSTRNSRGRAQSVSLSQSMGCSSTSRQTTSTVRSDPDTPHPPPFSTTPSRRLLDDHRRKNKAVHFTSCKESGCVHS